MDIAVADPSVSSTVSAATPKTLKRINYALAGTLIASGLSFEEAAKRVGAKSGKVLQVGLHRKGVTMKQAMSLPLTASRTVSVSAEITKSVVSEASAVLKDVMSTVLENHTRALSFIPAKADLKHITRVGQALEPLARTAKIVHGWGDESVSGLISIGVVEQLQRPGCGVEATTGSVPVQQVEDITPQSAQVIDIEGQAS